MSLPFRLLATFVLAILLSPLAYGVRAIGDLNNTISNNDGPNCHSATLLGLGYIDEIRFVGTAELTYFMKRFCQPTSTVQNPNTVTLRIFQSNRNNKIIHSYLRLPQGRIFEKVSAAGSKSGSSDGESIYRIKIEVESPYLQYRDESEVVSDSICNASPQNSSQVLRKKIKSLDLMLTGLRKMEGFYLKPRQTLLDYSESLVLFNLANDYLDDVTGEGHESLHVYAVLDSLISSVFISLDRLYNDDPSLRNWKQVLEKLIEKSKQLEYKIKMRNNESYRDSILKEAS